MLFKEIIAVYTEANDGFLRATKIRSTPYCRIGIKAVGPMSQNFTIFIKEILFRQNSQTFLTKFLLLRYCVSMLVTANELRWANQE
jgi:hypothetical protein